VIRRQMASPSLRSSSSSFRWAGVSMSSGSHFKYSARRVLAIGGDKVPGKERAAGIDGSLSWFGGIGIASELTTLTELGRTVSRRPTSSRTFRSSRFHLRVRVHDGRVTR
jgi:hypothetical protein